MKTYLIWMPLYTGDYLKDTTHLTKAEHGSYLLAMIAYWNNEGPLTTKKLYAVCGKEIDTISEFFEKRDGLWHHNRIDKELEKAKKKFEIAHEKAMAGVEAKRLKAIKLPTRKN